jgi:hypothetical protein
MSTRLRAFAVPTELADSPHALAVEIGRGLGAVEPAGPITAAIAAPSRYRTGWVFALSLDLDDRALARALVDTTRLTTVTALHHDDHHGRYWFAHLTADRAFELSSDGPYLEGDVDAVVVPYPQRGYSHAQLRALHARPVASLSDAEYIAISDYRSAVSIGREMFYPAGLDYLGVLAEQRVWTVWTGEAPRAQIA